MVSLVVVLLNVQGLGAYFGIITIMKRLLKQHSRLGPSFREIVESVPDTVLAFFKNFESARSRLSLTAEIDVLNAVSREEYLNCETQKSKHDEHASTVLMKWFEIFRDICILHSQLERNSDDGVKKNPNNFTTFARTFEPLAFLPDFWFAANRNVDVADMRRNAHALRLAFERYLYEREGGGVWGAMDWEMNRFLQRRIYESLKSDEAGALRRIAALALTARAVAAGELGLYIEERDDVTLPLSGISNVWNDPKKRNSLLKYYHYDRLTQLSFAREHEFAMDPNVPGTHVLFERQWMALAVISDVILKESDAHSTQAAATRVMLESVAQCMVKVRGKLLSKTAHKSVRRAAEKLYDLAAFHPDEFSRVSDVELLKLLGIRECPSPTGAYLALCKFSDAKDFWDKVLPIFGELLAAFDTNRDRVVAKYTEAQRRGGYRDEASAVTFVHGAITKGAMSELPGEIGKEGVRNALRTLLLDGSIMLQYATLDAVLTGGTKPLARRVQVWSEERRIVRELPERIPFVATDVEAFRKWTLDYLSALSERCALASNQERQELRVKWLADWQKSRKHKGDVAPKRDPYPPVKPIDYRGIDFADVVASADKLWNYYFTEDDVCIDRWIVSIDRVLKLMDDPEVRKYGNVFFNTTFTWPCGRGERDELRVRLEAEKARLVEMGRWPDDVERVKASLLARPSCTINELLSGESRLLVMVAILARLMVHTAVVQPALWDLKTDLFSFYTHILVASNHDFDYPFPWHLDVTTGSYLRIGRSHARQTNVVDDFVDGKFYDESERTAFIVFVAHYLAQQKEPEMILRAISSSAGMVRFFSKGDPALAERRIDFLRAYFS